MTDWTPEEDEAFNEVEKQSNLGKQILREIKPRAWVNLTNDELTDLFYNKNLGQQSAVSQAIALLKERNT
jgi:hypothetical protein